MNSKIYNEINVFLALNSITISLYIYITCMHIELHYISVHIFLMLCVETEIAAYAIHFTYIPTSSCCHIPIFKLKPL